MIATCAKPGCDTTFDLEVPAGESIGARYARSLAAWAVCGPCAAQEEQQREEAKRAQEIARRRSACQLPKPYRDIGLGDLERREGQFTAFEAVLDWANTKDAGSLVLSGKVGRGKTQLATAACWTRTERWRCRYASVARSMAQLNGSFSDEGRAEAVRVFSGTDPIVLDDLDKCRATPFGREQLFAAVDNRQQHGSPLLVTTNLTPDEIGETFGEPLMSRLAAPFCRVVEVGGPDWRVA